MSGITVVVAAGGAGKRFSRGADGVGKLLHPFGARSVLGYLVDKLDRVDGIGRIVLLTRPVGEPVAEAFHNRTGVEILTVEAAQTGGAVAEAAVALNGEPFLYSDGDVLGRPELYRDLVAALNADADRSLVSVSTLPRARTHLMVDFADDGSVRCGQGMTGATGTHVSLGVVAFGRALSGALAASREWRDLDEVLEAALVDPVANCVAWVYDGDWVAVHERSDLETASCFVQGDRG